MYFKSALFAFVSTLFLATGAFADSKQKVMEDAVSMVEEMVTILISVTDESTAKAAVPKLEALVSKKDAIDERVKKLGLDKKKLGDELKKDPVLSKKVQELMAKMMPAMMALSKKPEAMKILEPVMKKLN